MNGTIYLFDCSGWFVGAAFVFRAPLKCDRFVLPAILSEHCFVAAGCADCNIPIAV